MGREGRGSFSTRGEKTLRLTSGGYAKECKSRTTYYRPKRRVLRSLRFIDWTLESIVSLEAREMTRGSKSGASVDPLCSTSLGKHRRLGGTPGRLTMVF